MNPFGSTIQVGRVRSSNPLGRGGVIFSGSIIDENNGSIFRGSLCVVKAPYNVIATGIVESGQWWRVSGVVSEHERVLGNYKILEWQILAAEAELILPSGEQLVTLLAQSRAFEGIGYAKARKLWNRFGSRLHTLLDSRDVDTLGTAISRGLAEKVVSAWERYGNCRMLQWLHSFDFPESLGRRLITLFGSDAPRAVADDPYRLLSFCAEWPKVDALATGHFGLTLNDVRRVKGAVEESAYRILKDGHTVTMLENLDSQLGYLLGPERTPKDWRLLASEAVSTELGNSSFIIGPTGLIHPVGPMVMEMSIACAISYRLRDNSSQLLDDKTISHLTDKHEVTLSYPLTFEQRSAIRLASKHKLVVVSGDSGVGKTTLLQAIYQIYDASGVTIHQVALTGKTVTRMHEVTGRTSSTIAAFLIQAVSLKFAEHAVVVVDEASFLDIVTMWKLCDAIPCHVRILLMGNLSQLNPLGPGSVVHDLVAHPAVPSVHLTGIEQYRSFISMAAQEIRAGRWPDFSQDLSESIKFILCKDSDIVRVVVAQYSVAPSQSQILCVKRTGMDGVKAINAACQKHYSKDGEQLIVWNQEFGQRQGTIFYRNDLVMCSSNRWDIGVQIGSCGRLVSIEETPFLAAGNEDMGKVIGTIEWDDGSVRPLFESMLEDLELGYAITVNMAQGSQWPTVIVPLTANRLLDRTLLYTAITRAKARIVFVGDSSAAKAAVASMPKLQGRKTGLSTWLEQANSVLTGD